MFDSENVLPNAGLKERGAQADDDAAEKNA